MESRRQTRPKGLIDQIMDCNPRLESCNVMGGSQSDIVFRISSGGVFDFINEAVANLGWKPSDLIGKHFSSIIHPDYSGSLGKFLTIFGDPVNRPAFPVNPTKIPVKLIPRDWKNIQNDADCVMGTLVLLGAIAAPGYFECIRPADISMMLGIAGLITDIAPFARPESAIEKLSRFESIGIAASGIAHDFNNFLTGIYGNLQLAESVSGIPPEAQEYLDVVSRSFDLAKTLTFQLQSLTRSDAPARSIMTVTDILEDACSLSFCGSSIHCIKRIGNTRHVIEANRGQIAQLFCNLLINARQAMRDNGSIEIAVSSKTVNTGDVESLMPGSYEAVSIQDHGQGIPANFLRKIFSPYFTTRPEGSGLGLTVANSIARNHGGIIVASSVEGQGSTFTVYLPSAVVAPAGSSPSIATEMRKGTGRVLVMDDEKVVRDVICEILSRGGYESVAVTCGEHAIEVCRQAAVDGNHFDIAILDLTVPGGMGGERVLHFLRKHDPLLVAIAISGYLQPEWIVHTDNDIFVDFMAKPFLHNELLQKVSAAVETRRTLATRPGRDPLGERDIERSGHV
jgi:signal transduction histidine kinase/CheY-like chemotaxis protein